MTPRPDPRQEPQGVSLAGDAYSGSPLASRFGPYATDALSPLQFGAYGGSDSYGAYDSGVGPTGSDAAM